MQRVYSDRLVLPWSIDPQEQLRFRLILLVVAILCFVIGVAVPLIHLPEKTRQELEAIPPQLAKVVLEKRVIEPPKPVEQPKPKEEKREEPKPEKPKVEEPKPQAKPKPQKPVVVKPAPTQTEVEAAREVAQNSGLLALNDQLADMRESVSAADFQSAPLNTVAPLASAKSERLVSSISTASSGGVDTSRLATVTEKVGTGTRTTTRLKAPLGGTAVGSPASASGTGNGKVAGSRSVEEVRRVIDANKASIYAIYNRELRNNPTLQGQILLELTIEPSGLVSACKVISSELNDPELEKHIAARVQLFRFARRDVARQVITYPISFLPG